MDKKGEPTFDSRLSRIGIVVHVYSKDKKRIAISVRDLNVVEIYETGDILSPNTWKHLYTLKEHTQSISTLDWSSNDLLLTGSHDRSVMVWNFDKGQWRPALVILQENNRAITCGGWHEPGNKFCVGTGSHKIFIGYYEKEHNWWHSKKITNFKSTILAVKFHPSGRVIASGCADFSFKLISSYIKEVDDGSSYKGLFDEVKDYGTELLVIKNAGGWVESLAWSPSGNTFAYGVHTSEIFFGDITRNGASTEANQREEDRIGTDKLPFLSMEFRNDDELIAAGHDYKPHIFSRSGKKWSFKRTIEENEISKLELSKSTSKVKGAISSLSSTSKPQLPNQKNDLLNKSQGAQLPNLHHHKNPILSLNIFDSIKGNALKISTTDCNGNILFWDLN